MGGVEKFWFGGANNRVTQAGAAGLMTLVKATAGLLTAGDKLADQIATFGGQAAGGEFHKENTPVAGPIGTHLGEATWNVYDNPSVETVCDEVATVAAATELTLGGVQTYRTLKGPGSSQPTKPGDSVESSADGTKGSVAKSPSAIKAARQRGVNAAKAAERKLVQSGHPGTSDEGWSWEERKQIAETGQFPEDTRWHHINDVKRNPDLADVGNNVVPSRGGTAGHVEKYHPSGTQAGSSGQMLDRSALQQQHLGGGDNGTD